MSTELITLTQAAARLQPACHPITVLRRAQKDPAFPQPRKIAGRWLFDARDWEAFEESQQERAA